MDLKPGANRAPVGTTADVDRDRKAAVRTAIGGTDGTNKILADK